MANVGLYSRPWENPAYPSFSFIDIDSCLRRRQYSEKCDQRVITFLGSGSLLETGRDTSVCLEKQKREFLKLTKILKSKSALHLV